VGVGAALACAVCSAFAGSAVARPAAAGPFEASHASKPITGKQRIRTHQSFSTNWSGYAAFGDTFNHVTGTWTQPSADCSAVKGRRLTVAAFWAGLDGDTSSTVEQTGVDTICLGKTAFYQPWYEFFPARSITIPHTVSPGDTMTADVSVSGGVVTTTLSDSGHWTFSAETSAAGLALSSAEWIAEAPTSLLTNFGAVHFGSATATDTGGTTAGIDNGPWNFDAITLVNRNGRIVRAQPGSLTTSGNVSSFDDIWLHS
jgi:Peptidase A4 family